MPSRILVIGASGLIGQALVAHLKATPIKHTALDNLPDADVVINLAGANIAAHLWTPSYKETIRQSRVETTRRLIKALPSSTKLFISASSIGYYGDQGDEILTERSAPGRGFLASVTKEWEEASASVSCRRVLLRIAPVLSPQGGLLAKMLPAFRLGLGARLGSGNQWLSWIALNDLVRIFDHVMQGSIDGPLICASPAPIRQKDFAKTLAHHLHRPQWLMLPKTLLHLLPGGMGDELFLASTRCEPERLLKSGFSFLDASLEDALRHKSH